MPVADDSFEGGMPVIATCGCTSKRSCRRGAQKTSGSGGSSPKLPDVLEARCTALYEHYEQSSTLGARREIGVTRRCSSWSARTPLFRSWSSTGSPAASRTLAGGRGGRPCRTACRCSATSMATALARPADTLLIDSRAARIGRGADDRIPQDRGRAEIEQFKTRVRHASRARRRRARPTRTCCARS